MITIIKMGEIPNTKPIYKTTCFHCKTIFEHDESDNLYYENTNPSSKYFLSYTITMYVVCPLCKHRNIPEKIKS